MIAKGSSLQPEIPQKYKAVVYDRPGSISTKVVELDVPEPGYGEVLINLYAVHLTARLTARHGHADAD